MPISSNQTYIITPNIAKHLTLIKAAKRKICSLSINPSILACPRKTAKLYAAHDPTMIESNRLDPDQAKEALISKGYFFGRERDEHEVKDYYGALAQLEQYAAQNHPITKKAIHTLHGLVMGEVQTKVMLFCHQDELDVIKDRSTSITMNIPPRSKKVQSLMRHLVAWIKENYGLPYPVIIAVAHHQFATIYPYYNDSGCTIRLLTTLLLHLSEYDSRDFNSLKDYYANNSFAYYQAISVGPSHNYYCGRIESDTVTWIEYFVEGMAFAFEKVVARVINSQNKGKKKRADLVEVLDWKQRKVLELCKNCDVITTNQIKKLFAFRKRWATDNFCKKWVKVGFLKAIDRSTKFY